MVKTRYVVSRAGPPPRPDDWRPLSDGHTPVSSGRFVNFSLPRPLHAHSSASRFVHVFLLLFFLINCASFLFKMDYSVTSKQHRELDSSASGATSFPLLPRGCLGLTASRLSPFPPFVFHLLPREASSPLTSSHRFDSSKKLTSPASASRQLEKRTSVSFTCFDKKQHISSLSANPSAVKELSSHKYLPSFPSLFASTPVLLPPSLPLPPQSSPWMPFSSFSLPSILHVQALPPLAAASPAAAAIPAAATVAAAVAESPRIVVRSEGAGGTPVYGSIGLDIPGGSTRRRLQENIAASVVADTRQGRPPFFPLFSFFPFYSAPASPAPSNGNDGNPHAAESGYNSNSALPSSSSYSPFAVPPPTTLSSLPSSGGEGKKEHREKAAAPTEDSEERGKGLAGSSRISAEAGVKPKGEELAASLTNVNMLLLALCLLCCFTLGYFIHVSFIPHLPDSAAAMLTGVVFGLLARLWGASPSENSFLHFDPDFFYFVLLPPIVLEAGFCLNKAAFLYNLGPILLLSIFGTLLSTVIIAKVTLHTAHTCGLEGPPHELRGFSWVFASLISATDTVATLSIIGSPKFRLDEKGVDLYSILMGESVLNDAVSIALTRSCLRLFFTAEAEAAQRASGADVIVDFLTVLIGSLVLGIGIGGLCCFCFRHSKLKKLPEYEVAITMLTAYMAFGVAECLGFSGVVSLFFCGVMLGHFNVHNMSSKSRNSIDTVFKTIAILSEKTVFAYLGVVAAVGVGQRSFNVFFVLIALSACALSRAACVFPMSFISNRFRKKDERIDWKQQILIWLAGLRGAVAFALAMTIPCSFDFWRAVCRHNKDLVVTTTLILVAITTVGVGSILEYTAVKLGAVQPRRRSLSIQGYDASTSPSSALLLLEHHHPQQQTLGEEGSSADGSEFYIHHLHPAVASGAGREEEKAAATPPLFGSTSLAGDLRREEERTAAEELLRAHAAARCEVAQEMTTAAATLLRGPSSTAVQQQHGEGRSTAQRQQHHASAAAGSLARSPSSEQLWRRDVCPPSTGVDETAEIDRRETFQQRRLPPSDRFSRYESFQHQPFNAVVRFLYRLDREYLQITYAVRLLLLCDDAKPHSASSPQRIAFKIETLFTMCCRLFYLQLFLPWLGSSVSPSSSVVVAEPPYAVESRTETGVPASNGPLSPC